jgi:flagellar assembly protein FliH
MGHIVKGSGEDRSRTATAIPSTEEPVLAMLVTAQVEARETAVVLARKMAEKIIGERATVDPQVMREIAGRAVAAARPGPAPMILRVHPDDLAALRNETGTWIAGGGAHGIVKLVGDPAVGRHGCIVETATGRVDARLQTQLDALERALRGRVGG